MKTENAVIETLLAHIVSECQEIDTDSRYDEMLDECYSFESVGGIFAHMSPSRVLREVDPIAYRCGFSDWLDSEREIIVEVSGNYYDKREVDEAQEAFVAELESEESELETEIEDLNAQIGEWEVDQDSDEGTDNTSAIEGAKIELAEIAAKLETLRANINAARNYSF